MTQETHSKRLLPCPCCGFRTISELGVFEMCPVCWWEDDGQDNTSADEVWGGPNGSASLTEARASFLLKARFHVAPGTIRASGPPGDAYEKGREFLLTNNCDTVTEPATGWHSGPGALEKIVALRTPPSPRRL